MSADELADLRAQVATLTTERDKARADLASALAPNAADDALDAIARACGCAEWEYPVQVQRDVLGVVAQRDAAHASHAALAAAVREEREARAAMMRAGDGWMGTLSTQGLAERARHDMAAKRVVALLEGAPSGYVSAEVVRGYLDAREAVPEDFDADYAGADERKRAYALWDAVETARTALDAALAAAGGGA